jgi:NAD dependent epimerase/dehydratase family enzyme
VEPDDGRRGFVGSLSRRHDISLTAKYQQKLLRYRHIRMTVMLRKDGGAMGAMSQER